MTIKTTLLALILASTVSLTGFASVPGSAEATQALAAGTPAPDVALRTVNGDATTLANELGGKPAILIFYRGGWCPYCNRHLGELQELEAELLALGYRILAISLDRPEKLAETAGELETTYTLLSDSSAEAAKAFGLAFTVDAETIEKYHGYGIDLEKASGEPHHILPVPAAFIIDPDGIIRFSYANPDYRVRIDPEALIEAAKAARE